jgi:hypothetical protein
VGTSQEHELWMNKMLGKATSDIRVKGKRRKSEKK